MKSNPSAPQWLRDAAMAMCWPKPGSPARFWGIPLFINVQTARDLARVHQHRARGITYIAFMDTFVYPLGQERLAKAKREEWGGSFGRVAYGADHPEILLIDKKGCFVNTLMDGSRRMDRYLVCQNNPTYVAKAVECVKRIMELGSDGLFIDNVHAQEKRCYGRGLRVGYVEDYHMVATEMPGSRTYDPRIKALPTHTHLYPHRDGEYAFARLLQRVRQVVKSYGRDKVVVMNTDLFHATHGDQPLMRGVEQADAVMIESFVCSWAWPGRNLDWARIRRLADRYEPHLRRGTQCIALSYFPDRPGPAVKEDAFFCYGAARLCGFIWSDYGTLGESDANRLYRVDLGPARTDRLTRSGVEYRVYERGLICLNGSRRGKRVRIGPDKLLANAPLRDVYTGRAIEVADHTVEVELKAESARVYERIKP